jgi:hypothetical protein
MTPFETVLSKVKSLPAYRHHFDSGNVGKYIDFVGADIPHVEGADINECPCSSVHVTLHAPDNEKPWISYVFGVTDQNTGFNEVATPFAEHYARLRASVEEIVTSIRSAGIEVDQVQPALPGVPVNHLFEVDLIINSITVKAIDLIEAAQFASADVTEHLTPFSYHAGASEHAYVAGDVRLATKECAVTTNINEPPMTLECTSGDDGSVGVREFTFKGKCTVTVRAADKAEAAATALETLTCVSSESDQEEVVSPSP